MAKEIFIGTSKNGDFQEALRDAIEIAKEKYLVTVLNGISAKYC
jgi:hypothetical protein